MHTQYYGEIDVNWTDGEWERLQKIKNGEFVTEETGAEALVSFMVTHEMKDKIWRYAKEHDTNASNLLRNVMFVLTR